MDKDIVSGSENSSDLVKLYYRRPIEPWLMPCKDGDRTVHLLDRTALLREPSATAKSPQQAEEDVKSVNPYRPPKDVINRKPQNYGFPRYRMIEKAIPSKKLICRDPHGNTFQLSPSPRFNPFE